MVNTQLAHHIFNAVFRAIDGHPNGFYGNWACGTLEKKHASVICGSKLLVAAVASVLVGIIFSFTVR